MMEKVNLVFVPGLLCTDVLWRRQLESLADVADVRVTQQHLRHGSCDEMADAILAECPPNFAIAGSSMGGYVALLVKIKGGPRVTHICLVGSTANLNLEKQYERRQMLLEQADRGNFEEIKEQMVRVFLNADNLNNATMKNLVDTMAETVGLDCFTRQLKALIHGGDLRGELQKIDCPTLVLCGEEDRLLPVEQSREISRGIRQSKLVTLKGAAHLLPMERPDTVSELMQQWLTGTLPMDGTELTI